MEKSEKYWRLIPIVLIGTVLIYRLYNSIFEVLLYDNLINFSTALVGVIITLWTITKDFKEFKKLRAITCFMPSMTGVFIIITLASINHYKSIKQNSSTFLIAEHEGPYNGITIDLKRNGNYMISYGSFGGQSNYYGTYAIEDSIITLDKFISEEAIKIKYFRIKKLKSELDMDTTYQYYLFQTDKNGNQLNKETIFKIMADKSTKPE